MSAHHTHLKDLVEIDSATVRIAGDSGDGVQLVGTQFADISSMDGSIICAMPDYPSEIRAPAGTVGGVSSYQLSFGSGNITTPGDSPGLLIAFNPAALRVHLKDLEPGGIVILDEDTFTAKALEKAGYESNPLEDGTLEPFRVIPVPMTRLNEQAVRDIDLPLFQKGRSKNFFALGVLLWLFDRPLQPLLEWMMRKFAGKRDVMAANAAALRAGYNYANTAELFRVYYHVHEAKLPPGRYRRVTGNEAAAIGLVAAGCRAARTIVYASYPITPASDILHELSKYKEFEVRTLQVEDEIAACCAAIGASYAGSIGVTGTSGPGLALKIEALGLAVITELPLVLIDVQRAGPSTGLPTKTEQSDLFIARFGRHGDSPLPVLAAATPSDCFHMAFEAVRLATKYMTPVILLSDSFLANGAEPFRIPDPASLPDLRSCKEIPLEEFQPYKRDPTTLARPWVPPGTPGFEHRIGGLEKEDPTGNVTYDGPNHAKMTRLRHEKIARIVEDIPELDVSGDDHGPLLVLSWGSTYGAAAGAVSACRREGLPVSFAHLRYLNPFPRNLKDVLANFDRILIPENNAGQLRLLIEAMTDRPVESLTVVEGRPFLIREIRSKIEELISSEHTVRSR
ncbi:2-oxoacid:acceptor oxidoreductase subunit alpha [Thermostilla marina]